MSDDKTIPVYLGPEHLDLIALAMDRLACEMDVDSPLAPFALNLLLFFDELAEEANEPTIDDVILERKDNLIVVDFGSKED